MFRVGSGGNTLGKNKSNILGLITSALDVDDQRLHKFAQWLTNDEFIDTQKRPDQEVKPNPKVDLFQPVKFHDFSGEKAYNYCGFGLKNLKNIDKGERVLSMSMEMGLASNLLVDEDLHYPDFN